MRDLLTLCRTYVVPYLCCALFIVCLSVACVLPALGSMCCTVLVSSLCVKYCVVCAVLVWFLACMLSIDCTVQYLLH